MLTFEQFITEAQDEMGLRHRLLSGQVPPEKAAILATRQAARAKLSSAQKSPQNQQHGSNWADRIRRTVVGPSVKDAFRDSDIKSQNKTTEPAKITGTKERPALPPAKGTKPQPVTKANNDLGAPEKRKPIPNHLALSTKVKKPDPTQAQRSSVLNAKPTYNDKKKLVKTANILKKGRDFLKKRPEETPSIQYGKDLEGAKVFGPGTR